MAPKKGADAKAKAKSEPAPKAAPEKAWTLGVFSVAFSRASI